jgi:hypothetical protein
VRPATTATTSGPPPLPERRYKAEVVGRRLRIFWELEQQW